MLDENATLSELQTIANQFGILNPGPLSSIPSAKQFLYDLEDDAYGTLQKHHLPKSLGGIMQSLKRDLTDLLAGHFSQETDAPSPVVDDEFQYFDEAKTSDLQLRVQANKYVRARRPADISKDQAVRIAALAFARAIQQRASLAPKEIFRMIQKEIDSLFLTWRTRISPGEMEQLQKLQAVVGSNSLKLSELEVQVFRCSLADQYLAFVQKTFDQNPPWTLIKAAFHESIRCAPAGDSRAIFASAERIIRQYLDRNEAT